MAVGDRERIPVLQQHFVKHPSAFFKAGTQGVFSEIQPEALGKGTALSNREGQYEPV